MGSFSPRSSAIRIRTRGGLQSKMVADVCRACRNPECAAVCEKGALQVRSGGGIKFIAEKCDACGKCAEACPVKYLRVNADTKKPIVCKQCGLCANSCPYDVLIMEDIKEDAEPRPDQSPEH
ncbi:MAG: 4Fe-4S binding protein [Chitinophagales bacterium]